MISKGKSIGFPTFGQEFGQKKPSKLDNRVAENQSRKKASRDKFTHLSEFFAYLFDDERSIQKAQAITRGILKARCCRVSEIAREMPGNEAVNYKCIQRFVAKTDLKVNLLRLYQEEAPFLIGGPTEMPRPEAKKTDYVGLLSDGQTSGYWLLILATPYQGRAIPCHFVSYSSSIIGVEVSSRNRYHYRAFAEVKDLLGKKPLVLDREFSYLELMQALVVEQVYFVIRLKSGVCPLFAKLACLQAWSNAR